MENFPESRLKDVDCEKK